ncbi:ANTAR domain-containing protein [Pengzhenrongella phosphoraccumulans]|uniref:ANTAR domain-containing protein n=1 Tax=Pengzhenrongella phosphoraccumulans TaxID=3114394 RepID=UPI00388F223B
MTESSVSRAATRALDAHLVLVALLFESASVEGYLEEFARNAAGSIGLGIQCNVTLRDQGHDWRAASSDARTARCGDVALAAGSGPGLTALDERHSVSWSQIGSSDRWSRWRDCAVLEGFNSVLVVAADAGVGSSIALTVYSESRDPWSEEVTSRAGMFAQQIAQVISLCLQIAGLVRQIDDRDTINTDLAAAMASRSTIDMAIGVIMAQNRCSAKESFAILQRASSNRNIKLRDVAADIMGSWSDGEPKSGPFHPRTAHAGTAADAVQLPGEAGAT